MSPAPATAAAQGSLPQLSGRLLLAYRTAWTALAAGAVAVLVLSLLSSGMHPLITTLRLVKGSTIIAVAVILLRRRRRDPVAAMLSLAFLIWIITSSFDFASAPVLPLLLDRLRFLLFALSLLLFPDGEWRPAWTRKIAAVSAAVFTLGVAETLQLLPTRLFLPLAIGCVVLAVCSLVSRFRTADMEALKQQLRWVALGLVSGIGLILCARAGAAIASPSAQVQELAILWEALFQLGIVAIALGFLVALLRYRLFDAETAISRSAAYAVLTVALVATFAGTEALIERLGQVYLGMGIGDISAAMAAAVAAVLLSPLHSRISDWAEQRFQPDLVMLKTQLPELLADLSTSASTRELGVAALPRVCEAVHATHAALLFDGAIVAVHGIELRAARRWARDSGSNLAGPCGHAPGGDLFPVRLPLLCPFGRIHGWLVLGPRPDSTLFGKDEMEALNSITPSLRRAIASTMAREASRTRNLRKDRMIRRDIEELGRRLLTIESSALRPNSASAGEYHA